MFETPPSPRRVLYSVLAGMTLGYGVVSLLVSGFSGSVPVRVLQGLAVFATGALIIGGAVVLALVRLGGWKEPESEREFEALVQRSERLAASESWGESDGLRTLEDEPPAISEQAFAALVRSAVDELPLEFHRALEHVAIVISDGGGTAREARGRRGAYGLYQGDTVAQDFFHDRIVIFRDTLTRDFGHDPELLEAQVVRTVRHELAHHLGWGEKGVHGLGL